MKRTRHGRILGLDGLRAIAAFLVVLYHLIPGFAEVGFIGVDMFFVISGFLITALLVKEFDTNGSISLKQFWMRRIRRLVPAVVIATIGSLALARIFGGDALTQLKWQALGAITGTYNILQIGHSSSYFDQQSPLLLNNMWSLSVEQQFYLFWPLLLVIFVHWLKPNIRAIGALLIAAGSLAVYAVNLGADQTFSYVSPLSHSFGLMIGAAVALRLPGLLAGERRDAPSFWGYLSWVGLATIIILSFVVPDGWWMYPLGMLGFSTITAVVIRGILPDVPGLGASSLQSVLEWRPLVWLGHRSYGIYLWHWPLHVIAFYHPPFDVRYTAIFIMLLSILFADLSFRYVETPIRTQGFVQWLRTVMKTRTRAIWYALGFTVLSVLAAIGLVTDREISSGEEYIRLAQEKALADQQHQEQAPSKEESGQVTDPGPAQTPSAEEGNEEENGEESEESTPTPVPDPGQTYVPEVIGANVTVIGDSVTLASQPALQSVLPGVIVDGAVSRSIKEFPAIAQQYAQQNELRPYVVIGLGTNAIITEQDAEDILAILGPDRRAVFVTASAPEYATWVPIANATMRAIAQKYPERVALADWQNIALAHPEVLAGDRVHPDAEGGQLFADAIVQALQNFSR
ncbi:acetyltransferase [Arcanobacterium phocisimile]|uniref:Acetyltransferase n=1 Tax=Arcanobacterium phocisimile TaxID=1302235 RepID=A0ABX7IH77_9ACTO|nr:acyltransferase family protein [Arcanobacterium phocisimile]QRV02407.1 acetyltransferase [Arcanobacterium phocisimile]